LTSLFAQSSLNQVNGITTFLPFLLIGVIFYFLIIRPQTKQKKQHEAMLAELKKGDKILTRGGLYGTVINFQGKNKHKVVINAGSDLKVNIARSYIVGLADDNDPQEPKN